MEFTENPKTGIYKLQLRQFHSIYAVLPDGFDAVMEPKTLF